MSWNLFLHLLCAHFHDVFSCISGHIVGFLFDLYVFAVSVISRYCTSIRVIPAMLSPDLPFLQRSNLFPMQMPQMLDSFSSTQ
ncbi:unnamed protein product [Albugo candida]|uniref:Uncharacterized protein n=1 Tax=Albugo candida TaxID=65357 RepID=A0A024GF86_9STRA|nr:unnamed protein product [Albugo candida]|eukprot:CCI45206.1 unnamed protein product [Albugo candida]